MTHNGDWSCGALINWNSFLKLNRASAQNNQLTTRIKEILAPSNFAVNTQGNV
ncbi:hypothetical protein P886_1208 [Alteromonadaceae bacterium 2753L.S.0a.02]|nr:hypothetical protein P886_1208 [Alteromonadaceae bacterium 2753L.S.0a.02]